MITTCSMRHLYNHQPPLPDALIDFVKSQFERRRCNHHELEKPLPEQECLESVIIHNGHNKHRYCVAAQDPEIRSMLRSIPGVPMVYVKRSVMIMEPMADVSAEVKETAEMEKFRVGLKSKPKTMKRKREENDDGGETKEGAEGEAKEDEKKKKRKRGPKGPNPLSIKKRKSKQENQPKQEGEGGEGGHKRKRKRKTAGNTGAAEGGGVKLVSVGGDEE